MQKFSRIVALVLAGVMALSLLCIPAFADEAEPAELPALSLDKTELSLAVGESAQLTATTAEEETIITWVSLTTSVAQVDENGVVTGLSEGTATVKAKLEDGTEKNCTVSVYMAFPSYSLREGERVHLETEIEGGTWSSRDEAVARVDENGTVTAVGFGRTYITVSREEEAETGVTTRLSESFSITVGAHVGIDISSWNNEIDWNAVKAQGIEFVMIRAGYGWEHTDRLFYENIEGAIENGFPVGIYFYSYAETAEKAQVEADYCIKLLEPYKDSIVLPVAYDLEEYKSMTGEQLNTVAEVFCTALQDAGYHTMVYANSEFLKKMDLDKLSALGVDYWYAWYPVVPDLSIVRPIVTKNVQSSIWQYSSSCVVQGALASGKTDINVLYMPEYLDISAPTLSARWTNEGAVLRWGGSTYASEYTLYRVGADGKTKELGTYAGTTHTCTDENFTAGTGYYVTMTVCDALGGSYEKTYTSDILYPETAQYEVKVTADAGGTAGGGGAFIVGKTATVTAVAEEGYEFAGWYDENDALLSETAEYSFAVTRSIALRAAFRETAQEPEIDLSFEDVKAEDWFAGAVAYAVQNGLFTGTSDTTFAPMKTMDRSMLATVLYRLAGSPESSNRNKFVDVHKDAWYARAVTWAYNSGIMNGTGEKTFSPETPLTREQLATVLMRYSEKLGLEVPETTAGDLSQFTDGGSVSSFAAEGMRWAVATQLMQGSNRMLMPQKEATRAECATLLMRWLESGEG